MYICQTPPEDEEWYYPNKDGGLDPWRIVIDGDGKVPDWIAPADDEPEEKPETPKGN